MATRKKTTRHEMSAAMRAEVNAAILDENNDLTNAKYLFSTTANVLLLAIRDGLISAQYLARLELANRGLDQNGEWVGFERARQIHLIEVHSPIVAAEIGRFVDRSPERARQMKRVMESE